MRTVKTVVGLVLVACYAAGLVALFMKQTAPGLMLWVISTAGGMGLLWYLRRREREAADGRPQ
ncbi:hypothetical protein ACH6CV_09820 [Bacillota bacterium Meth-B3]